MQKHMLNELKTPIAGPEYSSRTRSVQKLRKAWWNEPCLAQLLSEAMAYVA